MDNWWPIASSENFWSNYSQLFWTNKVDSRKAMFWTIDWAPIVLLVLIWISCINKIELCMETCLTVSFKIVFLFVDLNFKTFGHKNLTKTDHQRTKNSFSNWNKSTANYDLTVLYLSTSSWIYIFFIWSPVANFLR